jgi:GntR family transcriptional regulator/MocR family aminotransferase
VELLEWAAKHGAAVIEDDYDSEFRFAARPLDSLQSLDRHGVVLYVGTFSKVLFPGVRTGFIIAPEPVRKALVAARELTDRHGPLLTQAALARFIQEGHLPRHIRKMRRVYEVRRERLLSCLGTELSGKVELWPSVAGLHVAVALRRNQSADAIAQAAERAGVGVQSLGEDGLALGYGAIEASRIEEGIRGLSKVFRHSGGTARR